MKKLVILSLVLLGVVFSASSQTIVGKWKTVDDETGKTKSVVEIYKARDGKYYGKINKLFLEPGTNQNPLCTECKGSKKNKPIIGMVIIRGLEKDDSKTWDDGTILDPESGKEYDCKITIKGKNLDVRGYIGFSLMGRSQTWLPYK